MYVNFVLYGSIHSSKAFQRDINSQRTSGKKRGRKWAKKASLWRLELWCFRDILVTSFWRDRVPCMKTDKCDTHYCIPTGVYATCSYRGANKNMRDLHVTSLISDCELDPDSGDRFPALAVIAPRRDLVGHAASPRCLPIGESSKMAPLIPKPLSTPYCNRAKGGLSRTNRQEISIITLVAHRKMGLEWSTFY